jgi:hypothetical protein
MMAMRIPARSVSVLLGVLVSSALPTARAGEPPGVVSHVLVVSDKVKDVSSLEAWKKSYLCDCNTDRENALAVWESVVAFSHQDAPPDEYLQDGANVHDPIKTFNVYGYGMCCCKASNVEALLRAAGLEARGRIIRAHSVPEARWGDGWHMLDASLINYMPKADGDPAGVDEILAGVKEWYAEHPDMKGDGERLRKFMGGGGWKNGPKVLARSPFYDENGWLPAATHGWYSTMQEYDGSQSGVFEYGYSMGYQVNIQLRRGERLVRRWSNRGLHVNQGGGEAPGALGGKIGKDDLRYAPGHGDLAPGRIGNGTHAYEVPLADGGFRSTALQADNLAAASEDGLRPAVHLKDGARPGVLVIDMPSSYVYLGGTLAVDAAVGAGGKMTISLSDNNGLDFKEVARIDRSGPSAIDIGKLVLRRYDYRLKVEFDGPGTGLDRLSIEHDIQHSQRALPALGKGVNKISFTSGPPEGTVTVECAAEPRHRGKQLGPADFHARLEGVGENQFRLEGGKGSFAFPIETPGDMVRLRFGCHYRARDARDGWDLQASFDGGKTFRSAGRCEGPTPGSCKYVAIEDVPPGTRAALVRWSGTQRNTTCAFSVRIDADYRQPAGGFRPVKVVYAWTEDGRKKRDEHVASKPEESYTIACAAAPVMESIVLELAE